jgi:hypothetical protein
MEQTIRQHEEQKAATAAERAAAVDASQQQRQDNYVSALLAFDGSEDATPDLLAAGRAVGRDAATIKADYHSLQRARELLTEARRRSDGHRWTVLQELRTVTAKIQFAFDWTRNPDGTIDHRHLPNERVFG